MYFLITNSSVFATTFHVGLRHSESEAEEALQYNPLTMACAKTTYQQQTKGKPFSIFRNPSLAHYMFFSMVRAKAPISSRLMASTTTSPMPFISTKCT